MKLGVISDTHGYLNPQVARLLMGVDRILHAGDIGNVAVVRELEAIAPVTAVRGNNDVAEGVASYPLEHLLEAQGKRILLTHQINLPAGLEDPRLEYYRARGVNVVVFGHSHKACVEWRGELFFFNPGAAGKPRFRLIPSVGVLTLEQGTLTGSITVL